MNKEKIIQMIEDYGSKQYEAGVNYGPADDMDADDFKDLQMRIYNIKNELDSKPVMPKVFDDWLKKLQSEDADVVSSVAALVLLGLQGKVSRSKSLDSKLYNWVRDKGDDAFIHCIEAIIHGYEVEG